MLLKSLYEKFLIQNKLVCAFQHFVCNALAPAKKLVFEMFFFDNN